MSKTFNDLIDKCQGALLELRRAMAQREGVLDWVNETSEPRIVSMWTKLENMNSGDVQKIRDILPNMNSGEATEILWQFGRMWETTPPEDLDSSIGEENMNEEEEAEMCGNENCDNESERKDCGEHGDNYCASCHASYENGDWVVDR